MLNPALVLFSRKKTSALTAHASRDAKHPKGHCGRRSGGFRRSLSRAHGRSLFSAVVVVCTEREAKNVLPHVRTCESGYRTVAVQTHMGAFRKFPHAHARGLFIHEGT